jgi:hypothetical protein
MRANGHPTYQSTKQAPISRTYTVQGAISRFQLLHGLSVQLPVAEFCTFPFAYVHIAFSIQRQSYRWEVGTLCTSTVGARLVVACGMQRWAVILDPHQIAQVMAVTIAITSPVPTYRCGAVESWQDKYKLSTHVDPLTWCNCTSGCGSTSVVSEPSKKRGNCTSTRLISNRCIYHHIDRSFAHSTRSTSNPLQFSLIPC